MKRLYLYYNDANGNKVHLGNFNDFSEMLAWSDLYCTNKSGHYYYKGNLVFCGYHLGR